MGKTVVINNNEGMIQAQMPHVFIRDAQGNPKQGIAPQIGKVIRVMPGANLIDSKTLTELRKQDTFAKLFSAVLQRAASPEANPERAGRTFLEVPKQLGKDGELPDNAPLSVLKPDQVRYLVQETLDMDLLKSWMVDTADSGLRHVIQEQIDMLRTGRKPAAATRPSAA